MSGSLDFFLKETHTMLQLSATKITTYMDCPLKFKFRYIDRIEPETVAPALAFGSSFHSALKHFHTQIMSGTTPCITTIHDMFIEYWRAAQTVPIAWNSDTPDALEQTGIAMLDCYIAGFADATPPLAVETSFTTPVVNLLTGETLEGVTITGIIDRITSDGTPVELKTASRAWTQFMADSSLQMTIYAAHLYHQLCIRAADESALPASDSPTGEFPDGFPNHQHGVVTDGNALPASDSAHCEFPDGFPNRQHGVATDGNALPASDSAYENLIDGFFGCPAEQHSHPIASTPHAMPLESHAPLLATLPSSNRRSSMPCRFEVVTKTKTPKLLTFTTRRTLTHFTQLYRTIDIIATSITQNHFYPKPCQFCPACDYFDQCTKW